MGSVDKLFLRSSCDSGSFSVACYETNRETEMRRLRKFWFDHWQWIIGTTVAVVGLLWKMIYD